MLLIDLRRVGTVDAAALSVLVDAKERADRERRVVTILGSEQVRDVLTLSRLDRHLSLSEGDDHPAPATQPEAAGWAAAAPRSEPRRKSRHPRFAALICHLRHP
jgi:hypothetical protein